MAGDYSRLRYEPKKRFSRLLMQQGRVQLDSDWNEMMELLANRLETTTHDIFGHCAAPRATTPAAFQVAWIGGPPADLSLQPGRYYVDGIVAEIFGDETYTYLNQPFLSFDPNGAPAGAVPPQITDLSGTVMVYIDVFQREVTYIEDPELLEVALGGPDTTTRSQTAWQVKLVAQQPNREPLSCESDLYELFPPSSGRLSSQAIQPPASTDPCVLPDSPGYRGIENRLYRIEIHNGGDLASARWKWSRDNASIVSRVEAIATAAASTLTVSRIGRDSVLRFRPNDWVEIIDDRLELWQQPGFMAQVVTVNESARTLVLDRAIPPDLFDPTVLKRHTRIRRWDQSVGVDGDGLLPITAGWMDVEDGVQIELTLDGEKSAFHVADYWVIAARSADASVEELVAAPPRAIIHHYCALATFTVPPSTTAPAPTINDCRTLWPPLGVDGDGCECTICVTPESHGDGSLTIQRAVDEVRERGGGKVCLDVGSYVLSEPLDIGNTLSLTIRGRDSRIIYNGTDAAIRAVEANRLRLEHLEVEVTSIGIHFEGCIDVVVTDCFVVAEDARGNAGDAIHLLGMILDMTITECILTGLNGITVGMSQEGRTLVTLDLRVSDCMITGADRCIGLGSIMVEPNFVTASHSRMLISRNMMIGGRDAAILLDGVDATGSSMDIEQNQVSAIGAGIVASAASVGIRDNLMLAASGSVGDIIPAAIRITGFDAVNARIQSNIITSTNGHGILMENVLGNVVVADNIIRGTGESGIVCENAQATSVTVTGNHLENIGTTSFNRIRGITLTLVQNAQVTQNVVRAVATVATSQAPSYAAIELVGCTSMIVTENRVVGIGPFTQRGSPGAGIEIIGTVQDATVSDNVVQQLEGDQWSVTGVAFWTAILMRTGTQVIRNPVDTRPPAARNPNNNNTTRVFRATNRTFVISERAIAFLDARTASAGVHNNTCYAVDSVAPVIDLEVTGPLVVVNNRVDHARSSLPPTGGPSAATSLRASSPAVSTGQNIVRTEVTPAMSIEGGSFSALGNMVSTIIHANFVPLTTPWDVLNPTGI